MADLDAIAAGVVQPLRMTATNVTLDAFQLTLPEEDEFVESEVALELLEFASSVVGGLSAAATTPPPGAMRSSSTVSVPLADSGGGSASASLAVTLYGPGDVRGVDSAQIVRRFPAPGTQSAEETVLAHIEFDRPELPWAFSAQPPGATMRPWLTLVVVEAATVNWEPMTNALLRVMQVPLEQLPTLTKAHLWAHAQAPRTLRPEEQDLSARLSPAHAPVNLSRLISPRVLKQDTDYVAAVVPTTDAGVRGGLGLTGGTLDPAWGDGVTTPVRLPVYDSWEFRTGPDGDFRALALRLQGVVAPYEVGRQFIDASAPGKPLRALADDEVGRKQVLRCALFSTTPAPAEHAVAENATWPDAMIDELREQLDLPAELEGTQAATGAVPDLPIIGPRLYAKMHRGTAVVEGTDWFSELNLSPVKRIVAGLGTRVVQKDQEPLMQSAWAQLGEVEAANRAIRLAQLAELLATRLHTRIAGLQDGHLLQVTGPVATRISVTAGSSLFGEISVSATPPVVVTSAFRRMTRPGSPVVRRADAASRVRVGDVVGSGGALRDFTRDYRNPEGIGRLTADAVADLDLQRVSVAADIDLDRVAGMLKGANAQIELAGGVATFFTQPEKWNAADLTFDPAAELATGWGERLLRPTPSPALESVRAQRVGPLVAELARSKVVTSAPLRERLAGTAITLNNRVLTDLGGAIDNPVIDGPVIVGPVIDGPVISGPVIDGPVISGPVIDGPIISGPVIDGPIISGPIISGPIVRGPGRGSPVLREPTVVDPVIRVGRHLDTPISRVSPIGGAVGRLGVGASRLRVVTGGNGRVAIDGQPGRAGIGLRQIDVARLKRIPDGASAAELDSGLKQLADLAEVRLVPTLETVVELPIELLREQMVTLVDPGELLTITKVPHRDRLAVVSTQVADALDPRVTVRASLNGRIHLSTGLAERWFAKPRIVPIMAAPRFDRPMYRALEEYDRDWLVPGLGLLPANDFVTVLSTNSEFMASFLVGLSDEMGRELLWRGYPTDQRGTYFRRFWNPAVDELGAQIHAFPKTGLAEQISLGEGDGRAVIVVKSELVRRFPDLVIQAVKNQGTARDPVFERDGSPQQTARVLFSEHLEPDIALVGVDLSIAELDGDDWWILIAEHPSATRFQRAGDDELVGAPIHLPDSAADAALFADDHLHRPVRVAFEATDLIVRGP